MKRRNFLKTGIYIGCAGLLGAAVPLCKRKGFVDLFDRSSFNKFLYKNNSELPKSIRLDVCNLCQLNCPACWMRRDEEKIKKEAGGFGYVPFRIFKNFVDKHPFIKEIELSHNGEIFLNPDLEIIIKYSYEKGIILTANNGVNLNTLSEKMAEILVKYKFHDICVSIDGATPETYSIYRRGGDFNTVINNVKLINKYKKYYDSPFPYMVYKFLLFGHNEHEIDDAKKLAKSLNMQIMFDVNCYPDYSPLKNEQEVLLKTGLKSVVDPIKNNFEQYKEHKASFFFCKDLFNKPQINFNGQLLGCCTNYLKPFKINVFKEGLLSSLNNADYRYAKMMLSDFSVTPKTEIPCSDCLIYNYIKHEKYPMEIFINGGIQ